MFYEADFGDLGFGEIAETAGAVRGALEALARADVRGGDEEDLCHAALKLEAARRFLDAAQGHVLAELDERGVTDRSFGHRTGPWLAQHAGLPPSVAGLRVRVARKLRRVLPAADAALTEGRIGFDHARVLADAANPRIEDAFAQITPELCDLSEGMVFDQWRREVQGAAALLDQDGGHDPDADLARNKLRFARSGDGLFGNFEFYGPHAHVVEQGLTTFADELFRQYSRDHEVTPELRVPNRATLSALAMEEAFRQALATDLGSTRAPRVEANLILTPDDLDRGSAQHRCCEHGETAPFPGAPGTGVFDPLPTELHVVDLLVGFTITDAHGRRLESDRYAPMLCDPSIYTLVVDSLGVPVDMGREIRFANRAQRRAAARRDGGCTFPGCGAPASWTDAHHEHPWGKGGRTDLDKLISLCRRHHGVAHRKGWDAQLTDDGWTLWTTPNGHQFWGQRHQRQRAGPLPIAA